MSTKPNETAAMLVNHLASHDSSTRLVGLAILQGLNPAETRALAEHIDDEIQSGNSRFESLFGNSGQRIPSEVQTAINVLQKYWRR